jgi:beta-glucosidase/6-phospho-beta-glucosidase/beta-galactosidase
MKFFLMMLLFVQFSYSAEFPTPFFFGLASAPGHAEDKLSDIWMDFAEEGKIPGFKDTPLAHERLRFWTSPEVDLDLVKDTGVEVFRLGLDWGRIMPSPHEFDELALRRYHEIINMVKLRNMDVMLTLMHHSIPKWAQSEGGWLRDDMIPHFENFAQRIIQEFHGDVRYWITFNESNIFATLAYTAGVWPPGEKRSYTSLMELGPLKGDTLKAMDRMSVAHNKIYQWAHQHYPSIQMGIAHHMGYHSGKTTWNRLKSKFTGSMMNWRFPRKIKGHMDFFGLNYYGAEWIKGLQVHIDPEEEYSEAGRAVFPEGLYLTLKEVHKKYPELPVIITENGIADATDLLRPSYLIEHLMAIKEAMNEGVPVIGYIFWTITDNLEWADGYCPKFGLVAVERENDLKRVPRESFYLFKKIVTKKIITKEMRNEAWNKVLSHQGSERPFCRSEDGITALATPVPRKIVKKDWRFRRKYE